MKRQNINSKTLNSISKLISEQRIKKNKKYKQVNKISQKKDSFTDNPPVKNVKHCNNKINKKKKRKLKRLQNNTKCQNDPLYYNKKTKHNEKSVESLREKLQNQLKSSRFRYLNEQLYTTDGKDAQKFFQSDPQSFLAYHEGFRQQVSKWSLNPIDNIIQSVKKLPLSYVIADFGCGDAKLSKSVSHKVHSFDLLETVPGVKACDMANCDLPSSSIDVAVYCLSLMGTNVHDYLIEANRVLKIGGILKIAEVESRFDKIETFVQNLQCFGFKLVWKDLTNNLFYFFDFEKERNIKKKNKLPRISLKPCLYKKR